MTLPQLSSGLLCLSLLLAGCGGDSLSAGGASLGGTGSTPGGGTDAHPTDPRPDSPLDDLHTIHYHPPVTDQCGALQRTIYFNNSKGEAVKDATAQETFNGRLEVIVELVNKGPLLLEKNLNCRNPIELFNSSDAEIGDHALDCQHDEGVSWRHYTSQKPAQYRFVAYVPQAGEQYYVRYQADYVQPNEYTTLADLDAQTPSSVKCQSLKLPFELVKLPSDPVVVPDDDKAHIDPIISPINGEGLVDKAS